MLLETPIKAESASRRARLRDYKEPNLVLLTYWQSWRYPARGLQNSVDFSKSKLQYNGGLTRFHGDVISNKLTRINYYHWREGCGGTLI